MFGHPLYRTLNRFADGELSPRRQRRVAAHLADCSRCRREVSFIRNAGELARSLDTQKVRQELLDRVLERRAEGERVLLPVEPPGAMPSRTQRLVPAAAAAVLLLFTGLFVGTGLLEADRGGLTIEPERPQAGDTLTLRYDGGFEFERETYLKVRTRYRTSTGADWQQIAGIMERDDEGLFTTQVALPDSVVYAAFAVEDLTGEQVDSNNRGLWDVMVHGADGRPTVIALFERFADLFGRGDKVEAHRTARLAIELYPNAPYGWSTLLSIQGVSGIVNDSIRAFHREQFRRLERHLSEDPPEDPRALADMALYALRLSDPAGIEYWSRQAERRGDRSATVYQAKAFLAGQSRSPAAEQQLEALWQEAPFPVRALAGNGWRAALQAEDWEAAMRWLPRYRDARGYAFMPLIAGGLRAHFPADRVLDWALAGQTEPFPATHRSLREPHEIHARRLDEARQRMLAEVAGLAREAGRSNVARGLALEALPLAWETSALHAIGTLLLEAGDTTNAAEAFARVAADPSGPEPPAVVAAMPEWPRRLDAARNALARWVLRESVIEYPEVEAIAPGRPTVVVFGWNCRTVDEIQPVLDGLGDAAVVVYLLQESSPRDGSLCGDPVVSVRRDPTGNAAAEFRVRGVTSYFVLDDEGRVRFRTWEPEEIPRQLTALRTVTMSAVAP